MCHLIFSEIDFMRLWHALCVSCQVWYDDAWRRCCSDYCIL